MATTRSVSLEPHTRSCNDAIDRERARVVFPLKGVHFKFGVKKTVAVFGGSKHPWIPSFIEISNARLKNWIQIGEGDVVCRVEVDGERGVRN